MTTFSTLSTALSSLMAQRAAIDVAGQNIANANTLGYTRQRAEMSAVSTVASASRFSSGLTVGQGVNVTGVSRLGDLFADARVRTTTASTGFLAQRAASFVQLESTISEPGSDGIANSLSNFWNAWHDVGNTPDVAAPGQVLLESAGAVANSIATGYRAVATQWGETRTQAETLVTQINTTAESIAELNSNIRAVLVSGGNANELLDHRNLLTTSLAELTGATVRDNADGTVNVSIGGNPLVSGSSSYGIHLAGSNQMGDTSGEAPHIAWDRETAGKIALDSGILGGMLNVLAPPNESGTGGMLAEAAATYNSLAQNLATSVNDIHRTGFTSAGVAGGDFFTVSSDPSVPAALSLTVAITSPSDIAAAGADQGAFDGSIADAISQLAKSTNGPDQQWAAFVVDVGVKTQSATQSAKVAEVSRSNAVNLQLSQTSVDVDEETVNMLAYQRAYQGAARVLTAVDEMLDILINRTGVVGR